MTITMVDLRAEAAAEARRLAGARAVFREGDDRAAAWLESDATWIALPRRSRLKRSLGRRVCLVWRAAFEDGSGQAVESRLVAVLVEIADAGRRVLLDPASKRAWIRSLLEHADVAVRARVEAECDGWAHEVGRVAGAFTSARLAREEAIAGPSAAAGAESQPGLFDRRVERRRRAHTAAAAESGDAAIDRIRTVAAGGAIARVRARLLLVLVP